jgi:hypothetical protein
MRFFARVFSPLIVAVIAGFSGDRRTVPRSVQIKPMRFDTLFAKRPMRGTVRIEARAWVRYNLLLADGGPSVFTARGDGDGDIDCYLRNARKELIKADNDQATMCILEFDSNAGDRLSVEIENLSGIYTDVSVDWQSGK